MVDMTSITAMVRAEDPSIFVPTSISKQFTGLTVDLAETDEAERALGQFVTASRNSVTPIMLAFDAILIAVNAYILAERELDGADCWDPACRNWRDDADAALARVEALIVAMRKLSQVLSGDKPLIRMRILLCIMLRTTTPSELALAYGLLTSHAVLFECAGRDLVAARVNTLLRRGRTLLHSLASVQPEVDVDGGFDLAFDAHPDLPDHDEFDYLGEAA